jgi:alkanesulfonate monooxygenase SsuD/methylene tetrahydromethanopterin reductase-like flavin-dependent oxidoreductase (luciferase family)
MRVNVFAMPTIPATNEEREQLRPIGRNTERYQMMLEELRGLVRTLDDMGFDAFATTEHHFHTEGGEANPNPLLMFAHLAAITEKLMFIPTSIVLTADDPIRTAEDIALFDQLYPGRVGVCFARGYQKRWLQVLSQRNNVTSWASEESDKQNREIFNEHLEVLMKAWNNDVFDYKGEHYEVPFPHEGIEGWAAPDWTRRFGADGEIDDDGIIKKIGAIPRPYQDPHPDVFLPYNGSPATLINAAKNGFTAIITEGRHEKFLAAARQYQEVAAEHGNEFGLGQNVGAVRCIALGDSYDEAFDIAVRTAGYEWHNYFELFGGATEAFRTPEDPPDQMIRFKDEEECTQRMIDMGHAIVGTVEEVREKMVDLRNVHADGNLDWLVWTFFAQGTMPVADQRRQLELFAQVLPDIR